MVARRLACSTKTVYLRAMPSRYELIILDFDGTFTDVELESAPFVEAYLKRACEVVGVDITSEWNIAQNKIRTAPGEYGWTYGGHIVAPGNADPYLRATVSMNMIFDQRDMLLDNDARTDVLQNLYFETYPKAATAFRPEAKEIVETLLESGKPIYVVTNSATEAVQAKLDRLAPRGAERLTVHGYAKKYVVTETESPGPDFDALPKELRVDGLRRPVFLRRGHYYDLLRQLWKETDTSPDKTFIAGDIYELDLAMPSALGVHTHLVESVNTASFERTAVAEDKNATIGSLGAALERALS